MRAAWPGRPATSGRAALGSPVPDLSRLAVCQIRDVRLPRWAKWLLGAVLSLVVLPFAVSMGLNALGVALITDDPLHPADAILVLGGESREGDRVRHAVKLFKHGLAPLLVLSGTPMGFRTHEAVVMRRHAEFLGGPSSHILIVKQNGDSTKEEADVVVPVLKRRGMKDVILVTSNYHTARA